MNRVVAKGSFAPGDIKKSEFGMNKCFKKMKITCPN